MQAAAKPLASENSVADFAQWVEQKEAERTAPPASVPVERGQNQAGPFPHDAKEIFRRASEDYEIIYAALGRLKKLILNQADLQQLANTIYALRETHKLVDDLRKEIDARMIDAQRMFCMLWMADSGNMHEKNFKTEYVTATPRVNTEAQYPCNKPKRFNYHPEQYQQLMDYLGVAPQLRDAGKYVNSDGEECDSEVLQINWPGLQAFVARLLENGYPLPDGIGVIDTYPVYKVTVLKKKGILEQ